MFRVELDPRGPTRARLPPRTDVLSLGPGFRCPVDAREPVVDSILSITVTSRSLPPPVEPSRDGHASDRGSRHRTGLRSGSEESRQNGRESGQGS